MTGDDVGTYASILAILSAGAGYVPISRTYPASRVQQILEQAEVDRVLTSSPHPALDQAIQASPSAIKILNVEGLEPDQGRVHFAERSKDDIAYVFFTSGSTGKPKGCQSPFAIWTLSSTSFSEGPDYGFTEEDRFLQMFSLTFDLSVMSLFVAPGSWWLLLCRSRCRDRLAANRRDSAKQGCDGCLDGPVGSGLPGALLRGDPAPGVRHSLFCGEALTQSLVEGWSDCIPNATIRNVYGPTEATIFCSSYDWSAEDIGPAGIPRGRSDWHDVPRNGGAPRDIGRSRGGGRRAG